MLKHIYTTIGWWTSSSRFDILTSTAKSYDPAVSRSYNANAYAAAYLDKGDLDNALRLAMI